MPSSVIQKKLVWSFILNSAFTIVEFSLGLLAGSLALMSDAAHNLTDSISLAISYSAHRLAKKPADSDHSFGHGRADVLAALINATILLVLAGYIFNSAYGRLLQPKAVEGGAVLVVALIGVAVNGSIALLFRKERDNLNARSAFLNMAFDTLASVGALLAGLLIIVTHKTWFDPAVSILIGVLLVSSAWRIVTESLHILTEGVPKGIDLAKIRAAIAAVPGVVQVDDLHVWSVSESRPSLICHLVIAPQETGRCVDITRSVKELLRQNFNIHFSNIELDTQELPPHEH